MFEIKYRHCEERSNLFYYVEITSHLPLRRQGLVMTIGLYKKFNRVIND